MNPGAVARFHAAQTRNLQQTYHRAWQHGVASYAPDPDPTPAEQEEHRERALLVGGSAAAVLVARSRRYRPPDAPDDGTEANALGGAREGLDRMAQELVSLTPASSHVDQATEAARAGEIPERDIHSYAEGLATSDWADSNAWRLDAGESVAWTGEQAGYSEAAAADGQLLEWLPEGDERVCSDCEQLGSLPPMPMDDWPTQPGAGDTICNAGCRCVLQVSDDQEIGPAGELPQPLTDQEEAFVDELAERREPYAEGPYRAPEGPLVGDRPLGIRAERIDAPDQAQVFRTKDALYAQAEVVKPEFDRVLRDAGAKIGAGERSFKDALQGDRPAVITAPLKAADGRATEKVEGKYKGDWGRLKDVVRGSIVVPSEGDLQAGLEAIEAAVRENPGWKIVGVENRYTLEAGSRVNTGANGFGYRDVSMHLVSPEGHVAELQLNTNSMMRAKELLGGHQLYEGIRGVLERDASTWTAEERALVTTRTRESVELYHQAARIAEESPARLSAGATGVTDAIVREAANLSTDDATARFIDGRLPDTLTRYTRSDGKLDPARESLHKDIIIELLVPHARQEAPEAMFTAGGPASGKSKFLHMPGAPADAVVIDPDIVRKLLPEYQQMIDAGRADIAAGATHEEASQIAKELTVAASRTGRNIIVDGVGDSAPGKFAGKIQQAVDAGYKVQVRYMQLHTDEAWHRAELRFKASGRKVAESELRQKHAEVSARYQEVLKLKGVHRVSLWDNSGPKGSEPKLVSSRDAEGKLHVHDPELQREFEAKVRELEEIERELGGR